MPLTLLPAAGPDPARRDKLMAFGRLAGQWTFKGRQYDERGDVISTDEGEIQIAWVLGGRALQDIWKETYTSDGSPGIFGTTVRFYDPKREAWHSVWMDPVNGSARMFSGRETADGIAFTGKDDAGRTMRWVFADVTETSFRWYSEREMSPGHWHVNEEMHAVRAD